MPSETQQRGKGSVYKVFESVFVSLVTNGIVYLIGLFRFANYFYLSSIPLRFYIAFGVITTVIAVLIVSITGLSRFRNILIFILLGAVLGLVGWYIVWPQLRSKYFSLRELAITRTFMPLEYEGMSTTDNYSEGCKNRHGVEDAKAAHFTIELPKNAAETIPLSFIAIALLPPVELELLPSPFVEPLDRNFSTLFDSETERQNQSTIRFNLNVPREAEGIRIVICGRSASIEKPHEYIDLVDIRK